MFVVEVLFLFCCFAFAYPYVVYPAVLFILKPEKNYDDIKDNREVLSVTAVIAARNEAAVIEEKIRNTLAALNQYKEKTGAKIDIIVTSDGSTDQTPQLAERAGVKVLHFPEGGGKELAQTKALKQATGDVMLFTDAKASLDPDAVVNALEYFQSPKVGAVSSKDIVIDKSGKPAGEGAYVKFEMRLREMESKILSIVGMSGSAFFVRRTIVDEFAPNTCSDFASVLFCGFAGLVARHGEDVICRYSSISDESKEYQRKVRTVSRGMQTFWHYKFLLYAKHVKPMFRFLVISHKPARWLSPVFFIIAFLSGLFVFLSSPIYLLLQFSLISLVVFASLGFIDRSLRHHKLVKLPFFFVMTNLAMLDALHKTITGKKTASWSPSER